MAAVSLDQKVQVNQLIADAERWQLWAAKMNAKAVAAGLVTLEEVQTGRMRAEAVLTRLRTQGLRDRIA